MLFLLMGQLHNPKVNRVHLHTVLEKTNNKS